ncbi:MAG: AAA family ATPase [Oscillospiraceae bacterium]
MEQESQMIQGTVLAVIYQNPENGYCVLKVRTEQGETVTVVGTIPMSVVGERLAIVGKWTRHQSFGQQFEAEFLERLMPETTSEILAFLSSRAVKGIGPRTAEKIVGRFGDQSLTVLEQDPMRLTEIPGITEKKAQEMAESFQRQSGIRRLIEFLTMYHLPAQLAVRLYRAYGELAQEALQDDPYLLTDPYYSADFSQVDAFAIALGVSADDERRVEAGILFELSYNLGAGHTFIPQDKLRAATCALLELDGETIDAGFTRLQEQERMQCSELAGLTACYLPELYEAETYVCRRILSMAEAELPEPKRLDALLETIEDRQEIDYAPEQLAAIRAAAAQQLLIVTGGPGTGKTTVMAGILQLFDELKLKTQLAAPTGRAAKRLSEVTGREASTIHRLLEAQFDEQTGAMAFYHDEDAPLSCDAMIVDETSMVDLPLMASLLKALKPGCRLLLVGDPDQLPPVGPGNVFSDLIRSGMVQTVRLTQIFRQAQKSLIVMNAHAVNQGELPRLTATDRDFFFLRRRDPAAAVRTIQELCQTRLPKNMGIAPADIQVLSPSRKHETGTKALNLALQAVLNPPADGKKRKNTEIFPSGSAIG